MDVDALCEWLAKGRESQRDKLATLRTQHLQPISAMSDPDHERVVREIKKRLNSPKLETDVAALLALLAREYAPEPPPPEPVASPPVVVPAGSDEAAAFEAAIAADPDHRDNYLVYGDWLAQRGDPRGALITIGLELAKNPTHAKMLAAHREHLAAHPELLGGLADCSDMLTGVEWAFGFIKRCRLSSTLERFNRELPFVEIKHALRWLLDEPGPGRFLQDLTLGLIAHDENFYSQAIAVLAARPRPTLRTLYVGDFSRDESELNWADLGDFTELWPQVPNLRELTLRGGTMRIGPVSLPKLERLTTITGGLGPDSVESIARAEWPELRFLSLQIGRGHEGAATDARCLEALLLGTSTPQLASLGILNCEFTDELCERLVASPLVDRIAELDLSMGTLGDEGVATLCAHADRLRDLAINIDDNYVTRAGCERMRQTFKNVFVGTQRSDGGDPEDRQASAFE